MLARSQFDVRISDVQVYCVRVMEVGLTPRKEYTYSGSYICTAGRSDKILMDFKISVNRSRLHCYDFTEFSKGVTSHFLGKGMLWRHIKFKVECHMFFVSIPTIRYYDT